MDDDGGISSGPEADMAAAGRLNAEQAAEANAVILIPLGSTEPLRPGLYRLVDGRLVRQDP